MGGLWREMARAGAADVGPGANLWNLDRFGLEGCGGRRTHPQEKEMKRQGPWGKEGGSSGA